MAFKTRSEHTAAVGHITMRASLALWWMILIQLTLILVVMVVGAWSAWASGGSPLEGDFVVSSETAAELANLALMTHLPVFALALGSFIGPANRLRDHAVAAMRSHTGRWFLLSAALTVALILTLKTEPSVVQALVEMALLAGLIAVWCFVLRGVRSIARSDDAVPYFECMEEAEKEAADSPWPSRPIQGFPDPAEMMSTADADRYARRAADIARLHDWLGQGLFVVSTAFLGAAVAQVFEAGHLVPWIWAGLSLMGAAAGYAVQRRGRAYHRIQEEFEKTSAELARAVRAEATERATFATWARELFRR